VLNPEHFVLQMMLEIIGVRIVISELKLQIVFLFKFNIDFVLGIVLAATDNLEWQEAHNAAKNGNPIANVE
jgi:hypothetical protein